MSESALNRARAALGLGRFDDGAREARAAIALDPNDANGYALLAQALMGKDEPEASMTAARDGLRHAPDEEWLHRLLALGLLATKRADEALAEADEAARLEPDNALCHKVRGDVLRALKRTPEAGAAYERTVALDPTSPRGHAALGLLCLDDDPVAAEKHYRAALELDPNDAMNLNNFGVALMKQDRTDEAAVAFKAAVLADPTLATAKRNVHSAVSNLLGDAAKGLGATTVLIVVAQLARLGRHAGRAASAPSGEGSLPLAMAVLAGVALLVTAGIALYRRHRKQTALANLDPQLRALFERVEADKKAKRL